MTSDIPADADQGRVHHTRELKTFKDAPALADLLEKYFGATRGTRSIEEELGLNENRLGHLVKMVSRRRMPPADAVGEYLDDLCSGKARIPLAELSRALASDARYTFDDIPKGQTFVALDDDEHERVRKMRLLPERARQRVADAIDDEIDRAKIGRRPRPAN